LRSAVYWLIRDQDEKGTKAEGAKFGHGVDYLMKPLQAGEPKLHQM